MKPHWNRACLWHLGFLVGSAVVAFPCLPRLPRTIEGFRYYHGDYPLILPAELLLAKHLSQLCCILPVIFAVLLLLSFFRPEVTRAQVIYVCGFGLAAVYGLFVLVLALCMQYALLVLSVK
jgi:hypothetical protein